MADHKEKVGDVTDINVGDTISRQAAIDVYGDWYVEEGTADGFIGTVKQLLEGLPPAQPEPSEITDEQAILHLQSTGWMQNHDREMYESGLREQLADDSGGYDSLIPCEDTISRQAAIDALDCINGAEEVPRALPPAQPEQKWIPCSERLPENRVSVIVCFREWQQYAKRYVYSIVVGWYARKHSVHENVFSDWEADCEYDEIEDEYYIEEGWYEFTTQGNGDLMNWYINADVIAWMPLPEPYQGGE